MKKLNILYTIWGTSFGGAEKFVLNVIKHLDKTKFNIVIFSDSKKTGPLKEAFEKEGVKVITSDYHRFKHPIKFTKQIKRVILEEKIDLIHANDDFNMIFPLVAKPKNVRFIAHSHSTKFYFTKSRIITAIARLIIPRVIRKKADVLVGCSNETGKKLFGKKKFIVASNGIDLNDYYYSAKTRSKIRNRMGISGDEKVILNIGRMDNAKNQTFLVDVFAKYQETNNNSKLVIIGDGPEREDIANKICKLGLADRVIILPPQDRIFDYYNVADVFVMTSKFEGLPMVLIEAQANGLPIVASSAISKESKVNENFEFVKLDSTYGEWADIINKMGRQKPDKTISEYSIDTAAKILEGIYES